LKESLDLFEKAIKLSQTCDSALEYARQRAQALAEVHGSAAEDSDGGEGTL
jgi:exodeoxyribonuclease VII small subunit